ncbi:MAG TPA: outer membrane protein transport protein, partial [Rhodocyclaceae bacterium]
MKSMLKVKWISIAVATAFSGSAMAAGFALQNQNGSGNGNAFAGAAAAAEDAGTIFFNPAGMALLPQGKNVAVAGTYLDRSVKFTDAGTSPPTLSTTTSTNGGDAGGS